MGRTLNAGRDLPMEEQRRQLADPEVRVLVLASAVPGGAPERVWRQLLTAFGLGLLMSAPALCRWLADPSFWGLVSNVTHH